MGRDFGPHLTVLVAYSWLFAQGLFLVVLRKIVPRITPGSAVCNASPLISALAP